VGEGAAALCRGRVVTLSFESPPMRLAQTPPTRVVARPVRRCAAAAPRAAAGVPARRAAAAAALPALTLAAPALADDAAPAAATDAAGAAAVATGWFSATPLEIGIALAPLIFYVALTAWRQFNPRASVSDLAFILAAVVILGNIFSILVLKVRLF
jgi:hypothetical protein